VLFVSYTSLILHLEYPFILFGMQLFFLRRNYHKYNFNFLHEIYFQPDKCNLVCLIEFCISKKGFGSI
jgi:hypothetical protein